MKKSLELLGILILASLLISFAGSRVITGNVTDENGQPLAGVNVIVKGSQNGTVTDSNGFFKLSVNDNSRALVFSLQGYKNEEVRIDDRNNVNVVMRMISPEFESQKITGRKNALTEIFYNSLPVADMAYESSAFIPGRRQEFNTEGYASVNENGFRSVSSNPLSTFSIDVDNASYSNIRRFINTGTLPPPDAVRIEEMINYFTYSYPEPRGEHPFFLSAETAVCPWNRDHLLLQIGLRAESIDKESLPPSNLVFLIDVSGSMKQQNKLPLLKSAFGLLVRELRPQDHVAVVVYAGAAGLVLKSTPGNRKAEIMHAIDNLEAGGSTAGGEGLRLAYCEAEKNFIQNGNNRIILATDGDFNVGESSNGGIERLVEEERKKNIFITVLGFGMGNIKDDKMEIIADKGNGNYSYIDNLQEARRVLVREFGGTLFTIAKDVKLQVEFNPALVSSYRLVGYENRLLNEEDFNDDAKDAGEMGSGHTVTALYEIVLAGSADNQPSIDPLKYQESRVPANNRYSDEMLTIKVRYKEPDGKASKMFERSVTDASADIGTASENMRFAAAVAEFGMILGRSEFAGTATLESAAKLAASARGEDPEGYRGELVRLIHTVRDMGSTAEKENQRND